MLTAVDKMKINKYLKEHALDDLYYTNLCDALGKRGKIKDIEFLEYFVELVIKEFNKNDKISMKHVTKIVSVITSFVGWIHDDEGMIEEHLLDKIRSLEEYYDAYLNRTNFDIDLEFTDGVLASLQEKVNEFYPCESKNESVIQYLQEIDSLKEKMQALHRELDDMNGRYKTLSDRYEKKEKSFQTAANECGRTKQALLAKDKEIEQLQGIISSLEKKVSGLEEDLLSVGIAQEQLLAELSPLREKCASLENLVAEMKVAMQEMENRIAQLTQEKEELLPYKDKCAESVARVEILESELRKRDKAVRQEEKKAKKESKMEALIYQYLLLERMNIDAILLKLQNDGYTPTKEEVYQLLQKIKSKIHVDSGTFALSPEYRILAPIPNEDGCFDIQVPTGCKHYDILLVSDCHLDKVDSEKIERFHQLNEYCKIHKVPLILNLGDFFEGVVECTPSYDGAVQSYQLVDKAISLLPREEGVYHAVLGGNHDERFLQYGIDPIGMLAEGREDFLSLGYRHCTVTFNGTKSMLSSFGLHHPSNFDYSIRFNGEGLDSSKMLSELDSYYARQGRTRNDSYVELFGHMHKSLMNFPESYYFVPALVGNYKGACHLRVYFDEETKIKYMLFSPLIFQDMLFKSTEILYKKKLF